MTNACFFQKCPLLDIFLANELVNPKFESDKSKLKLNNLSFIIKYFYHKRMFVYKNEAKTRVKRRHEVCLTKKEC